MLLSKRIETMKYVNSLPRQNSAGWKKNPLNILSESERKVEIFLNQS